MNGSYHAPKDRSLVINEAARRRPVSTTQNNRLTGKAPYKFESISLRRGVSCELKSFRGVRGVQQKTGCRRNLLPCSASRAASTSADHGLRGRRHGGDVAAVWREKQTEAGSDDRIALEGSGEMIEIPAA